MATMTGRDVILTLMNDVAELRADSQQTKVQLGHVERSLEAMSGNVEAIRKDVGALAKNVDALGKNMDGLIGHVGVLARSNASQTRHLERMGRTLVRLANVLGDHEERITALAATK